MTNRRQALDNSIKESEIESTIVSSKDSIDKAESIRSQVYKAIQAAELLSGKSDYTIKEVYEVVRRIDDADDSLTEGKDVLDKEEISDWRKKMNVVAKPFDKITSLFEMEPHDEWHQAAGM